MELMKPTSPNLGFDFGSVPSSPRRFGQCFFSAPTSPSRMSEFYREFDRLDDRQITESSARNSSAPVPFDWEDETGTPKSLRATKIDDAHEEEEDFAFDFHQPSDITHQLSAEELFDGGKIKPFKPPPSLQFVDEDDHKTPFLSSSRSPKIPFSQGKKLIQAFSLRRKKDHSETAIERTRENTDNGRGRQRVQDSSSKNSSRRTTRSLSPYRVPEFPWEEEQQRQKLHRNDEIRSSNQSSLNSKPSLSSKGSSSSASSARKWKLKDLLLFRSASEGHNKDPLKKYSSFLFRKSEENCNKNSSFKSKDSSAAERSKRKVSAHELHYTTNKAASENMKKKTFLPYKHGILGKLAFNSNGFAII